MTIQEKIRDRLEIEKIAKNDDKETQIDNLKFIIGEMQRNKNKVLKDSEVIALLQRLVKTTKDKFKEANKRNPDKIILIDEEDLDFINLCESFLPEEVTFIEVRDFINSIDPSTIKNHKQIIGITIKHFKSKGKLVDGKSVSDIVDGFFKSLTV